MKTVLHRNSTNLLIPKDIAKLTGMTPRSEVELTLKQDDAGNTLLIYRVLEKGTEGKVSLEPISGVSVPERDRQVKRLC